MRQKEIEKAILQTVREAHYIMGDKVYRFEKKLVEFIGGGYAITCSSGSSAILLALMGLGIQRDDEIITTPFTFIATAEMIALLGAKPVFVDINLDDYNINGDLIEQSLTEKTRAILAVSLYGQPPDLKKLEKIAQKHGIKLIIDGAQSFGAEFEEKKDSLWGDVATTSFFPAKPLGCYGDGGAVFSTNECLAQKIASLRVHGQEGRYIHKYQGIGARLDALQATILKVKLKYFSEEIGLRNIVAQNYKKYFHKYMGDKKIILPKIAHERTSVFAQYTIRVKEREKLRDFLKKKGIPSSVHYPLGLHLQECFKDLGYKKGDFPCTEIASDEVLSLPMNPYLKKKQIEYICKNIAAFNEHI